MKIFNVKYIPLTIVVGFNLFTLFIFYTAPITWKTDNLLIFLLFSLLCQWMIVAGYKIGFRKYSKKKIVKVPFYTLSPRLLNFIFFFYSFTFIVKYAYLLKFRISDISGMVRFLLIGLYNQNIGYNFFLDPTRPFTVNWSVFFLIAIINQVFFIIGFVQWRKMNMLKKCLFSIFVLIELFYWMGRGTNFGVISMITTLLFALFYKYRSIKLNLLQTLKFSLIIIFLLVTCVTVFDYNMAGRRDGGDLNYDQFDLGKSSVDEYNVAFSVIPKPLHDTYMYVVSYLSQGYYHTCLAFDLDYQPTYFLGSNAALLDFSRFAGIDVWKDTYMYRLREKGVDPLVNWHSAYTWYANDFTFIGVPFVLFIIGYLFGVSWVLSLNSGDFLSRVIFIILGNMLLFLFANNTYLSSVFYSFMFILPIWYFSRLKPLKSTLRR